MGALLFLGAFVVVALVVHFGLPARAPAPALAPALGARRPPALSPLGAAIEAGDTERVRGLLSSGTDPNAAARDDMPALHTAVGRGATGLVRPLLDAGAHSNHVVPQIGSALGLAAARGDAATARALVDAGIDHDLVMEGGAHALHLAALGGHIEIVKLLLDRGFEVDRPNHAGGTALRSAADAGHGSVVGVLLASGARTDVRDRYGKRPTDYASAKGHDAIVRMLAKATRGESEPPRAPLEHVPFAQMLPRRSDATINIARQMLAQGLRGVQTAASSLEAPSCAVCLREPFGPSFEIGVGHLDTPDPREPIRDVRFRLWRYERTRPERIDDDDDPDAEDRVLALAIVPYSETVWWERAAGEREDEETLRGLCGAMTDPGPRPRYLDVWDWWFRTQVAAAFRIARAEGAAWVGSLRREALLDLADGPADWSNTAAILALGAVARHDESAVADVRSELLRIARRPLTSPAYQHAISPAACALLDLGGLDEPTRAEMEALVRGPEDENEDDPSGT